MSDIRAYQNDTHYHIYIVRSRVPFSVGQDLVGRLQDQETGGDLGIEVYVTGDYRSELYYFPQDLNPDQDLDLQILQVKVSKGDIQFLDETGHLVIRRGIYSADLGVVESLEGFI